MADSVTIKEESLKCQQMRGHQFRWHCSDEENSSTQSRLLVQEDGSSLCYITSLESRVRMSGPYMIASQLNVLSLLHDQYRLYTIELSRAHEGLNKQYKKLHKAQRKLDELEEQEATRAERRKLTWSRATARQTIAELGRQQSALYDLLQQCRDLIASYNTPSQPLTPWTTYWPYDGFPFPPWTANTFPSPAPQYWDLSMLGEQPEAFTATGVIVQEQDLTPCWSEAVVGSQLGEENVNEVSATSITTSSPTKLTRAASSITVDVERANLAHRRRFSENITKSAPIRPSLGQNNVSDEGMKARLGASRTKTAPELSIHTEALEEDFKSKDKS